MADLYGIVHTARCGSTLLAGLLSTVGKSYAEPEWAKEIWLEGKPVPIYRDGSIVKLPSFAAFHCLPHGPKVFLYRPLSQHLLKMRACEKRWLESRWASFAMIDAKANDISSSTKVFAEMWAQMAIRYIQSGALPMQSNYLFSDPENAVKEAIAHFGLSGLPDMRFASINVKKARLNGQNDAIIYPTKTKIESVEKLHGCIDSKNAMSDKLIAEAVDWITQKYPSLSGFVY